MVASTVVAAALALAGVAFPAEPLSEPPAPAEASSPPVQEVEQEEPREPPEPPPGDRIGGFQLGLVGGSQLVGSSSGQIGGVIGYYFKPTARFGVEMEGGLTLGPGGRVFYGNANLVIQAGARTSRFVPYGTVGAGVLRAEVDLPGTIQERLDEFDVSVPTDEETAPYLNYGGGLRYYFTDTVSLRGDYREYLVVLDIEGDILDRLFSMRRIAGILSFEF